MPFYRKDFPFTQIKDEVWGGHGDYFNSAEEAMLATGLSEKHIWSVIEGNEDGVYTFGPSHHFINVLGYVATKEPHDGDTYYEERE